MVIHPPMLYLGYVGFVVPFAFGVAALLTRQLGSRWIETIAALDAVGLDLPGHRHHARRRAGPTSNWAGAATGPGTRSRTPSLMPWLAGTAFLHSVIVQERAACSRCGTSR